MPDLPGLLVDADWVARHLDEVLLADVRWYLDGRSGRDAFEAGHLPGAFFVDLDADLSSPVRGGPAGRHPLPSPAEFAAALGRHGIGADDCVIAYDDTGGATAARFVWMLRAVGQPAALLDGGLAAWPGPLETGHGTPRLAVFVHPRPWPEDLLADTAEVARVAGSGDGVVLDARAPERYRGEVEPVDPRAGHIPGARNAPWTDNLEPGTTRFRPAAELRARYEALGVRPGTAVVSCGSGVSACADWLAIEHAGLGPARLYVASWSGWSADPANPVRTGDEP